MAENTDRSKLGEKKPTQEEEFLKNSLNNFGNPTAPFSQSSTRGLSIVKQECNSSSHSRSLPSHNLQNLHGSSTSKLLGIIEEQKNKITELEQEIRKLRGDVESQGNLAEEMKWLREEVKKIPDIQKRTDRLSMGIKELKVEKTDKEEEEKEKAASTSAPQCSGSSSGGRRIRKYAKHDKQYIFVINKLSPQNGMEVWEVMDAVFSNREQMRNYEKFQKLALDMARKQTLAKRLGEDFAADPPACLFCQHCLDNHACFARKLFSTFMEVYEESLVLGRDGE